MNHGVTLGGRQAPGRPRFKASPQRLVGLISAVSLLSVIIPTVPSGAQSCSLVPVVRHVTVNQGTDTYSPLAWGKDTILRVHMTLPECAGSRDSIKLTGGSLDVAAGALKLNPTPIQPTPLPSSEPAITECCTAATDVPGDPKFVIAGSVLSPPAGLVGPVPLSFSYTINYKTSAGTVGTLGPETVLKTLGRKTNGVRMLVVPMGDKALTDQFTDSDLTAIQNGMLTASRMLPVANGVGNLSSTDVGVRWQLAPTLLDLGAGTTATPGLSIPKTNGKYCLGNEAVFDKIRVELAKMLHAWNSANPLKPADRVVGAIGEGISLGSVDGCFDGQAAIGSVESWVRAISDATNKPSITGAILVMELAHNIGAVPPRDFNRFSGWHSISAPAEGLDRAYNLSTRAWMSDDRSVMHYAGTWHNHNTLLEAEDWFWTHCMHGGSSTGCAATSRTGAPAGNATFFRIHGSTDGTPEGTDVVSNRTQGGIETDEATTDQYQLVLRDGGSTGAVTKTFDVPVSFDHDTHGLEETHGTDGHEPSGGGSGTSATGAIDTSVLLDVDADTAQLWKGGVDAGTKLYEARLSEAPEILAIDVTPTEWGFENHTNTQADEVDPALSLDGNFLAYVRRSEETDGDRCGTLIAENLDTGNSASLGSFCSPPSQAPPLADPAFAPDAKAIAYTRDGDLWRVDFDPADQPAFGGQTRVYSCVREANACVTGGVRPPLTGAASGPAWSPTSADNRLDQWLVFSVQGDLYKLFPFRPTIEIGNGIGLDLAERLTETDALEDEPTVGPASTGPVIAFRYRAQDEATSSIRMLTDSRQLEIVGRGRSPSWGGELIAYEGVSQAGNDTGDLFIVNPDNPLTAERITGTADIDAAPALLADVGKTMAMSRRADSSTQADIYLGQTRERRDITIIARDRDNAAETRGFVYAHCAGVDLPIKAGLIPHQPFDDKTIVVFTADNHDPIRDCGGANAVGGVSDRWTFVKEAGGPVVTPEKPPVAAILAPTPGDGFRQTDSISLVGAGWDAEGFFLPDSSLTWSLQGPGFSKTFPAGGHKDLSPADVGISGGLWPLGTYNATLTVTDGDGKTATAVSRYAVPYAEAVVDFEPDTLYVPSSGNPVTLRVELLSLDIGKVVGSTVRIVELGGKPYVQPAQSWKLEGTTAIVKFDRATLTSNIPASLLGSYVKVTIEGCSTSPCGSSGGFVFRGEDPTSPVAQPAS